jgi:hypothetical protein
MWPVKGRLGKIVLYVENPDKTIDTKAAQSKADTQSLYDVINYAMSSNKTVDTESEGTQVQYVTGINCTATGARDQMMLTKRQYNKEGGIVAYHGYQSFKEGEVTPDLAHTLGVQLAKELWGDRFRCNKTTYGQMKAASDRLCRENNLSVINEPNYGNSKQYENGEPMRLANSRGKRNCVQT